MKLKAICAWYTKTMEVKELDGEFNENTVSQGICVPCKDKALEELLTRKLRTSKGGDYYVEYPN